MKKCPKCGAVTFYVTAHVAECWLVDEHERYIGTIDFVDVVHRPDNDDIWECANCGYYAEGRKFNVPEETKQSY